MACDALVVQAWHAQYAGLDFGSFTGLRAVLDGRGAVDAASVTNAGGLYVGIGG
jgi:hypothetical protein